MLKMIEKIKDFFYGLQVKIHQALHKNAKEKKRSPFQKRRKEAVFYYSIVVLPILQFCIFYVAVNLNSLRLAFSEFNFDTGSYAWVGFKNFSTIWKELRADGSVLWGATLNSLGLWVVGLLIGTVLSLVFSYYIYKGRAGSKFFQVLLFMPSIISSIVLVMVYSFFMDNAYPVLMEKIFHKTVTGLIADIDTQWPTIIAFNIYIGFGTSTLMYASAMAKIDESVVEAAQLDGIGPMREFLLITVPLIYPTITTFLITGIAGIFNNQANVYSFFGQGAEYSSYTVGYYIFVRINSGEVTANDYAYLSAVGLFYSMIIIPVTLLIRWLLGKLDPCDVK